MTTENQDKTKLKREVFVPLSEAELAARGRRWAQVTGEITRLENELKQAKQDIQSQISNLKNEAGDLKDTMLTGKEKQTREVDVEKDFNRNRVAYYLNGTLVDERPMEARERQMEMEVVNGEGFQRKDDKPDPKMAAANDKSLEEEEPGPIL